MSVIVDVEPSVVKRIREMAGWKASEVAERIRVPASEISDIEAGRRRPTLTQLRGMANAFDYPVTVFFLTEPPEQDTQPKDLRAGTSRSGVFDKETILAIRKTRYLQSLGAEMSKNLGRPVRAKVKRASLSDDPKAAASKYRSTMGLGGQVRKSKDASSLFGYLRAKIERMNILVFKFAMPMHDARGFTLSDEQPAVIVVNSSDSPEGRLFTLVHELGHVLLGDTSIDLPEEGRAQHERERWCNDFASSLLLPDSVAKELFDGQENPTDTETLERMSKTCKVSKAFLLFKMVELGRISRVECERVLARPGRAGAKPSGGYQHWDRRYISEMGKPILSLVEESLNEGFMTYADALGHLSLKSHTFDRVMKKI